jgi:argininosuccinate lyase
MANVGRTTTGQPDSRIFAYGEIPRLLDRAAEAVELMAGVTATFTADLPRMATRAGMGFSQATDLAEALMLAAGLPYESAHHVVGELVARAVEQDVPAARISPHMLEQAAQAVLGRRLTLSPQQLEEILDPQAIVATRTTLGGAAPQAVDAMLVECREKLAAARGWRERTAKRIESAEAALLERAAAVTAPPNSPMEE